MIYLQKLCWTPNPRCFMNLYPERTYLSENIGASRCWYSCCISTRRTRGRRDRPAPSGPGPPAASTTLCTPIPATSTASGRPRSSSCWRCCASTATCSGILVSITFNFYNLYIFGCLYPVLRSRSRLFLAGASAAPKGRLRLHPKL